MANPEQVTISLKYFLALQDVRRAAEGICLETEGTDDHARAEDHLENMLGAILMIEEGKDPAES